MMILLFQMHPMRSIRIIGTILYQTETYWKEIPTVEHNPTPSSQTIARAARDLYTDIVELVEKPVIKKQHFESAVVLRVKQLGRDEPQLAIRDFRVKC